LVKVVTGLSEYAKAGGPRLGVRDITAGGSRVTMAEPTMSVPGGDASSQSAIMKKIGEQLDAERPWVRLRLSLIFALVTILTGVLVLRMVLPGSSGTPRVTDMPVTAAPPMPTEPLPAPSTTEDAARPVPEPPVDVLVARFERMPTLVGNALPAEAADAADEALLIPERLDGLARRLTVSSELALAGFKDWEHALDLVSTGWVLVDLSTRQQIEQAVLDVLFAAADEPATSDRLLQTLAPSEAGAIEPLDIWRGAWRCGMLAEIASNPTLPPVVVDEARRVVDDRLPAPLTDAERNFVGGADRWLHAQIQPLVQVTEFDPRTPDRWELWIAAQRSLGAGERFDESMVDVLEAVLVSGTDLSKPGPSQNVVGRMLLLFDVTASRALRRRVPGWFEADNVTTGDLWVLTSLLSIHDRTPWFDRALVLPPDADDFMRRRISDHIARAWNAAAGPDAGPALSRGRGVEVDPVAFERWQTLHADLVQRADAGMTPPRQLVAAARLNAAAALLAVRASSEAWWQLDQVKSTLASAGWRPGQERVGDAPSPGQAIGVDGQWAQNYEQSGRAVESRLGLLRALRNSAGTDLGPVDAAKLVGEAYRGAERGDGPRRSARLGARQRLAVGLHRAGHRPAVAGLPRSGLADPGASGARRARPGAAADAGAGDRRAGGGALGDLRHPPGGFQPHDSRRSRRSCAA
ncbi:MAG: hypothetical protein ACYTGC_18320, partial [Planctomycetota bacterium]